MVVYLSDGYLKISENNDVGMSQRKQKTKHFFKLASRLPMDLQMVLCNRAIGLGDSVVKGECSEQGFVKFAACSW